MKLQRSIFIFSLVLALCWTTAVTYGQNLALRAKATASESLNEEMSPEKANDDNTEHPLVRQGRAISTASGISWNGRSRFWSGRW